MLYNKIDLEMLLFLYYYTIYYYYDTICFTSTCEKSIWVILFA